MDFFGDAGISHERAKKYAASVVEKERTGVTLQELNGRNSLGDLGIFICQDVLNIAQHAKRMCETTMGGGDRKIQNKMEVDVRKEPKSPAPVEVVKAKVDDFKITKVPRARRLSSSSSSSASRSTARESGDMARNGFPSEHMTGAPPPPEPKSYPRTVDTNRRHVERLQRLTVGNGEVLKQRVILFGDSWFERFTSERRNNGTRPFTDHVRSCADQVDVCAVGGDKVSNALWRSGEGGALEALAAARRALKTDVFILLGINDITARASAKKGAAGKGFSEKISSDVVGGVCTLAGELKERLRSDCTRIHVLEVPLLPLYELPGNEGMIEEAVKINNMLRSISTQGGFEVRGWEQRLLSLDGSIRPEWLISRSSVHLNAKGYDVFARLLRSLILQKDFEDVDNHVGYVSWSRPSLEDNSLLS